MLSVLVLAAPAYRDFGQYSDFYDGGVYLESARMLASGYAPYRAIFMSQPPAWLELIRASFALFGQSMGAAQLLTVSALVVAALAAGIAVLDTGSRLGGLVACATILSSSLAFFWSREITGEMPSAAFAALSLALASRYPADGKRIWLALGAVALSSAILIKLFAVYALPSMLLVVCRRGGSAGPARQRLRRAAADVLLVLGIVAGMAAAAAWSYGAREVWAQSVAFHLDARADLSLSRNWSLIAAALARDPVLFCVLPLALCAVLEPWVGWAAFGWAALTLIGLLNQHPLFTHHIVALIPPLALAAGIGTNALLKLSKRLYKSAGDARSDRHRRALGLVFAGVGIVLLASVCRGVVAGRIQQRQILASRRPAAADLDVAADLERLTGKADFILTDAPGIVFRSGRSTPPWLADSSLKRIDNHYLSIDEVARDVGSYQVKAVLLWTGRLDRLPGLRAWLERTFPTRITYGARGGVLYLRPGFDLRPRRS